ncbi:helix-turn-helix domain-containing protein [Capilliphycus salinus ALCB114379]|uniref:helix-turn-helix domain-containing protein n=1 Tax=Capilliphycus salinus TaxID=2768948 RepID=UPI0039A571C4
MLTLTYEFKLILSSKQIVVIEEMLAVCRNVWNYALRERKDWISSRKCAINCCSLQQEYVIPADTPYPNYNVQAANLTFIEEKQLRTQISKCSSLTASPEESRKSI